MQRHAHRHLAAWFAADVHRPLVLRGARQTGKTFLVKDFCARSGHDSLTLDVERDPQLARCFEPPDPRAILALLEARFRQPVVPGRTVLFLDEIQAVPELLGKLRYFAEELPALHVIACGSLLEFTLAEHSFSMPVGRITYGHLEPLTFAEFLHASGEERLSELLGTCTPQQPPAAALHQRLLELMREYAVVGGMPAAVAAWIEHRSWSQVSALHRDLLSTFRDNFAKYRHRVNTARIAKVLAALPRMVGRKFKPTEVDREDKSLAIKEAFRQLGLARLVTPVQRTAASGIPLGADVDESYQKVCMLDVGLYVSLCGLEVAEISLADLTLVNDGQLAEQLVGQELRACRPFNQEPSLFTWVREAKNSNAEVDYVRQIGSRIVPIEVKAGATGTLRSLQMMVAEKRLNLAVRVSSAPLSLVAMRTSVATAEDRDFRLLSVPFYLVSELPRLIAGIA